MYKKNLFELWDSKELPERIQEEVDGFAKATKKKQRRADF